MPQAPWSRISLVPQVLALARELTICENVTDVLPGSQDDPRTRELLVSLALADVADRFIDHVSTGQQQRTAVARAVIANPILLLADEPTSSQSSEHTAMVVDQLQQQARRGSVVIVATHDPQVWAAADRTVDLETAPTSSPGALKGPHRLPEHGHS
jgi:ABC-type lipoprotein export system ATPase subunit